MTKHDDDAADPAAFTTRHAAAAFAVVATCAALVSLAAAPRVAAQAAHAAPSIYSCTDAAGKRLTSDRPIAACGTREQRVLNADGSVRQVLRPVLTADERSDAEAREREADTDRKRQQEAIRRDRNLLARYPNEAAHRKARELALEAVRASQHESEARLERLAAERKPLVSETEFYVGKPLPIKLKLALDANDASVEAQKTLIQNQQTEALRIGQLYDAELERLKRLWAGVPPGSLGPVAGIAASASAPVPR